MAHNRVVIYGTLGGGIEDFTCSIAYSAGTNPVVSDAAALATWAEAIRTLFQSATGWAPAVKALIGSNGNIVNVKCYYYPVDSQPATQVGVSTGGSVAGSASLTQAPQTAMAVSLVTGVAGRSFRGRFYWPAVTATIGATFRFTGPGTLSALATAFAQMLDAIGDAAAPLTSLRPAVYSRATGSLTPVSSVSVGDVLDTQRRRRDRLAETRAVAAVP